MGWMGGGEARSLRRNRDFVLLQAGRLLSSAGTQSTTIAYPLLALALTGSAASAGIVAAARAAPQALLAVPGGVIADRFGRKGLMILADGVRVAVIGGLAVWVWIGAPPFWVVAVIAFVEGCGAALFAAAQPGALRAVVPTAQLPAAVAVETGRDAVVQLAGPPIGGALYTAAAALPFGVDAVSYAASTASLLRMRTPFEEPHEHDSSSRRARVADGFRFVWQQPFVRLSAFLFGLTNFLGPGLTVAVVVLGDQQGLGGGQIGLLVAALGGCLLLGSVLSSLVRRRLPVRAIMLLEFWCWVGCAAFVVWPNVYVLVASIVPAAVAVPSTDSVVHAYRLAITPDRLLGRAESVRRAIALVFAALGPLAAGFLLASVSDRAAIGVFALVALVLAIWGSVSPVLRSPVELGRERRIEGA
jgi:MFS family permease